MTGKNVVRGWGLALLLCAAAAGAQTKSDDPFVGFISPISNPVNFEDPRAQTEIRPIFAHHDISNDFANGIGMRGGYVNIVAVQARYAVTDRLAIIATKDGYVWVRPTVAIPGVIENNTGWANVALGAKYAFLRDPELGAMATAGLRYEIPSGDAQALQGRVFIAKGVGRRGNGVINPFLSGLWGTGDFHALAYTGLRLPLSGLDSMFFDLSLHADYALPEITFAKPEWKIGRLYPTIELNWVEVLQGGDRVGLNQEGFDFFNLGSSKAGGTGVVTMAFGARWRFTDNLDLWGHRCGIDVGAAYELPVTDREDIFGWRVTTDVIFWMI